MDFPASDQLTLEDFERALRMLDEAVVPDQDRFIAARRGELIALGCDPALLAEHSAGDTIVVFGGRILLLD